MHDISAFIVNMKELYCTVLDIFDQTEYFDVGKEHNEPAAQLLFLLSDIIQIDILLYVQS